LLDRVIKTPDAHLLLEKIGRALVIAAIDKGDDLSGTPLPFRELNQELPPERHSEAGRQTGPYVGNQPGAFPNLPGELLEYPRIRFVRGQDPAKSVVHCCQHFVYRGGLGCPPS
jgi:hypothetical protein